MVDRYGDYELQQGDSDSGNRWGGAVVPAVAAQAAAAPSSGASTAVNTLVLDGPVLRLQRDLATLGFGYSPDPATGDFDLNTEFAVREFQVYARFARVAHERMVMAAGTPYVERLEGVANTSVSSSEVTGILDAGTRTALRHWLVNNFRCPVVIQARDGAGYANLVQDNLWSFDDMTNSSARVFVRDFSDKYSLPVPGDPGNVVVNGEQYLVLGYYESNAGHGPNVLANRHSWGAARIAPNMLFGTSAMSTDQQSTYTVIMATAEAECGQSFDVVNAWDDAYLSVPIYHHTLGQRAAGELPALLSYVRDRDAAAFDAAVGFAGVRGLQAWPITPAIGAYATLVAQMRAVGGAYVEVPRDDAHYNYFRGWHWIYRFSMAGRTIAGYRTQVWNYARLRLAAIHGADFGQAIAGQPTTVGAVFTSEFAMGMLLRRHVWRPAHILNNANAATPLLRTILQNAQNAAPTLNWNTSPATWTNAHETALVGALQAEVAASTAVNERMQFVYNYRYLNQPLSQQRGSFHLLT